MRRTAIIAAIILLATTSAHARCRGQARRLIDRLHQAYPHLSFVCTKRPSAPNLWTLRVRGLHNASLALVATPPHSQPQIIALLKRYPRAKWTVTIPSGSE
jgi:hypothetical protein